MDKVVGEVSGFVMAVLGLATLALILKRSSDFGQVVGSFGQAVSSIIGAATLQNGG